MAKALAVAAFLVFFAFGASAQENTISFPIAELGGCSSKAACHQYCDDLAHVNECVAFAEKHGLMSAEEAQEAREFSKLGGKGPGGCTSKDSCEAYCEDPANMRQCLAFAKQNGVMSAEELQEAEKVAVYIESGGKMPGGCRGERECKVYCADDAHVEECMEFGLKAGFMSEKEAEIFKKTGGVGPGGCKGRACEAFCEDESNREQCIGFALEHGLMSEEDRQRMQEGMQKAREALQKAPAEVLACIEEALGSAVLERVRTGQGVVTPKFGEVLPACFKQLMGDGASRSPFRQGSDATDCMRKIFGEDFEEKMRSGELDPGARDSEIRACMQEEMGEGFLNESGQWERPQRGEPPAEGDETRHQQQDGGPQDDRREQYESQRKEMEQRMRAEMEEQMRSGNFDRSKLPPDYRPEGVFPPPESQNRPPEEGSQEQSRALSPLAANILTAFFILFDPQGW